MMDELRRRVYEANMLLPKYGLVTFTWGNVSGVDRERKRIVIKPSGVSYDQLSPENMVVVDFNGNVTEGSLHPSSDTPTHIELYKHFPEIGGVVHTHSACATSFAQAITPVLAYGTTHADYFYGEIPCTERLTEDEVADEYEKNTGKVIAKTFERLDYKAVPGVLAANHGPFSWGATPYEAVYHAVVLEEAAKMAYMTLTINPAVQPVHQTILDKHYFRKHGENAYYGNREEIR